MLGIKKTTYFSYAASEWSFRSGGSIDPDARMIAELKYFELPNISGNNPSRISGVGFH